MRCTRQSGAVGASAIEAVVALADADYVSRRWPGFEAGFDAPHLAERLRGLTVAEAPPINPLLDWGHLARLGGADGAETALAVLADYAGRGLPAGLSPHPLLRERIVRRRAPGTLAGDGAWVRAAFADADADGRTILPVLDSTFVLTTLGVTPHALADWGFRSVGRFYLAEAVRRGVPPCAAFDPVFVLAASGRSVAAGAAPPIVLAAALAAYLDGVERGEAPSPSPVFDEAFVRATQPAVAAALEDGAGSALAAWLDLGSPPIARTASGLDSFPEAMPQPWWERDRHAAVTRGRKRLTPARLTAEAIARVRTADPPALAVRVTPQMPEVVFAGETVTLFADGFACSPGGTVATVALCLGDDEVAREVFQALPRAEAFARSTDVVDAAAQLFGGFALAWTGPAPAVGHHAVTLRVGVAGPGGEALTRTVVLGTLKVRRRPVARRPTTPPPPPTVGIAMATFEPDAGLFASQIASIRAQTVADWRLVISDESESVAGRNVVARATRGDPRITVHHGARLGVVGNFERALRAVDPRASFVALADQDDRWRPDKLERLLVRMTEGVALVHGAMRLVDAGGRALPGVAETRRLPDPLLADLLAENEVTGASALMRMSVVDAALPLPRLPGLFHDHWLALVARVHGRAVFEPSVVQDYVQHGGNVVGEDPRRDRAAAARLGRERASFAQLLPRLSAEGDGPSPAVAGRALLPAAFAVVPAAVMRLAARDALVPRRPPGDELTGSERGFGVRRPRAFEPGPSADVLRPPEAGRLTTAHLAAFARTLAAATGGKEGGKGDEATVSRLGVASWLADGFSALEAIAGRPALKAAIAAMHHRRAAAKAR